MEDYKYIKYLCANKCDLPPISFTQSSSILHKLKPSVSDFFSVTPNHFIHAGMAGLVHYNLLLNTFIIDVNNCAIKDLNTVLALLLYITRTELWTHPIGPSVLVPSLPRV